MKTEQELKEDWLRVGKEQDTLYKKPLGRELK